MSDRLALAEVTRLHGLEDGVELIHLELAHVELTQEIVCKGLELVHSFSQPLQHRVGVNLEHPRRGPNAKAQRQTRQHTHDQLHGHLLPMQDRAMMFGKIALARGVVELSPGTATRMAVGPEVAQPAPAAIATARIGTEVLGGIDRAGAAMRRRQRVGAHGRGRLGRREVLLTQGTVGFLG
jgi:hypothetical protein